MNSTDNKKVAWGQAVPGQKLQFMFTIEGTEVKVPVTIMWVDLIPTDGKRSFLVNVPRRLTLRLKKLRQQIISGFGTTWK